MDAPELTRRLRDDAADWPAEEAPDVSRAVLERLAPRHHDTPGPDSRRSSPWPLLLPLAAALLIWVDARWIASAPRGGPPLAVMSPPAPPPIYEHVDRPLLDEWQRLSKEASGTARYLARQVSRPLHGLGLAPLLDGPLFDG